jgi:CheY-like chemotaxis protein
MDVNLGAGIDGIEAASRIRAKRNIPIVFVTAYTGEASTAKIKAAVPDAVIVGKPISAEQLQAVIITILDS